MPEVTRIQRKDLASDLDEIAREGARRMLAQALEAEFADYIPCHQERDENGRAKVVRNGNARSRKVTLGCICEPGTQSSRPSPRCGCASGSRRGRAHARRASSWL